MKKAAEMHLVLVCQAENDLYHVLQDNNIACTRYATTREAMDNTPDGTGMMVLADGYPEATTAVDSTLYEMATGKNIRLYIEFPAALPDMNVGEPCGVKWERAVVSSGVFAPQIEKLRILMIHGCQFVPLKAKDPHIVTARVAGFDTAVYNLPEEISPILFEHPCGSLLVSTTKLSHFVTARYAPNEAWQVIWQWILGWICPEEKQIRLVWTPTVRPFYYQTDNALPEDVEKQAFQRGVQWYSNAKLLIHPSWKTEAKRRLDEFYDGVSTGPEKNWLVGDGTCGMIEGANSTIHSDGSQNWRYHLRNDCMGETSMAMAFEWMLCRDERARQIAGNLNDFIYFDSNFTKGPRANPESSSYGLVAWTSADGEGGRYDGEGGRYYGDDNARSMLGTMAVAALSNNDRWDESLLKCLLANLRTTGPFGFRDDSLNDNTLQEKGWRHYFNTGRVNYAPHFESWLWACFLWAYQSTGLTLFLERARTAIHLTMEAYPEQWRWTNGMQQERARMLLPLAWLVRVENTEEHRKWLRFMAGELLSHQAACGAIQESIGDAGKGIYGPPASNEQYATTEAPLIQQNGDPLCDMLYTANFAFVGLHEAAAATGETFYTEAEERLAKFLCRIQVRSETHPELDGAWFRAFDYKRWEYWASNADSGWGAWSIESGWTQAWITSVLGMRQLKTSFWDLTLETQIRKHLKSLLPVMLPDYAISKKMQTEGEHA